MTFPAASVRTVAKFVVVLLLPYAVGVPTVVLAGRPGTPKWYAATAVGLIAGGLLALAWFLGAMTDNERDATTVRPDDDRNEPNALAEKYFPEKYFPAMVLPKGAYDLIEKRRHWRIKQTGVKLPKRDYRVVEGRHFWHVYGREEDQEVG